MRAGVWGPWEGDEEDRREELHSGTPQGLPCDLEAVEEPGDPGRGMAWTVGNMRSAWG